MAYGCTDSGTGLELDRAGRSTSELLAMNRAMSARSLDVLVALVLVAPGRGELAEAMPEA